MAETILAKDQKDPLEGVRKTAEAIGTNFAELPDRPSYMFGGSEYTALASFDAPTGDGTTTPMLVLESGQGSRVWVEATDASPVAIDTETEGIEADEPTHELLDTDTARELGEAAEKALVLETAPEEQPQPMAETYAMSRESMGHAWTMMRDVMSQFDHGIADPHSIDVRIARDVDTIINDGNSEPAFREAVTAFGVGAMLTHEDRMHLGRVLGETLDEKDRLVVDRVASAIMDGAHVDEGIAHHVSSIIESEIRSASNKDKGQNYSKLDMILRAILIGVNASNRKGMAELDAFSKVFRKSG